MGWRDLFKAPSPPKTKVMIGQSQRDVIRIFVDLPLKLSRRSDGDDHNFRAFWQNVMEQLDAQRQDVRIYPHYIAVTRNQSVSSSVKEDTDILLNLVLKRLQLDRHDVEVISIDSFPRPSDYIKPGVPEGSYRWPAGRSFCECCDR